MSKAPKKPEDVKDEAGSRGAVHARLEARARNAAKAA